MSRNPRRISGALAALLVLPLAASEHRGVVQFGGLPLPGATVTATQGERRLSTISSAQGGYAFADLADGVWTVEVEMQLFAIERREVQVSPQSPALTWELKLLPAAQIDALVVAAAAAAPPPTPPAADASREAEPAAPAPDVAELAQPAADGLLINGSVNNSAVSRFALLPAFGNNRRGPASQYNGNIGWIVNQSALDARPFSLTG